MRPVALLHLLSALVGTLLAAACLFATVAAVDIPVTTPTDLIDLNGDCSLREAIEAANTDSAVDGCPAGAGADVILIPTGTITLSISPVLTDTNATGDLDLLTEMTLQGVDARSTVIDGAGIDRILHISTTAAVTVADLALTNGRAPSATGSSGNEISQKGEDGGGILNEGRLTLQRVTVSNNRAGNGESIIMPFPQNSIPGAAGRGGGIYNSGLLTIEQSALVGNEAGMTGFVSALHHLHGTSGGDGGGIFSLGDLTIFNSTIGNNRAPDGEDLTGPFYYYLVPGDGGSGGGIANEGQLTLNNVTLVANYSGRGGTGRAEGTFSYGDSGVGGGIHSAASGTVNARNALLAGNKAAITPNEGSGELHSLGYNLLEATGGCRVSGLSLIHI